MIGNVVAGCTATLAAGQAFVMPLLAQVDPIISALFNAGGMGLLAAVLFYLHTQSLKGHREEMQEERKQRQAHHMANMEELKQLRHSLRDLQQMVRSHHDVVNHIAGVKHLAGHTPIPPPERKP